MADASRTPLESLRFVTLIFLVIAAPRSLQARVRNIVGGHILSALSGVLVYSVLGASGQSRRYD